MLVIFYLVGIFISEVRCGYYFVLAPNVIRFDHEETVVASVFGLKNAKISIWLQHGEKKFSQKDVTVIDEETPSHVTVEANVTSLFDPDIEEEKPRTIKLCSQWNGKSQCRDIVLSYRTGYLIVQTDKPIYTPRQKVRVRALALDESMKAVDGWQVAMDIISPKNATVARKIIKHSETGFYENIFIVPEYADTGIWTARAFYRGQLETQFHSRFEVRKYVLPTFGVTINVDVPYITPDTDDITITVKGRYVYGKPVDGKAKITLNLVDQDGISEFLLESNSLRLEPSRTESIKEFKITVKAILETPLLKKKKFPDGCRLEVIGRVYESVTGKEEAAENEGTIFATKPYIFKFTRSRTHFQPGMEYFLKVDLLYANGEPASKKNLKLKIFENGNQSSIKPTSVTKDNGKAGFNFQTSNSTKIIRVVVSITDDSYKSDEFEITAYVGKNQIQVEHAIINEDMVMRAFTSIEGSDYTGIFFVVISKGQILHTLFKKNDKMVTEKITEEIQEKVSPSGRILAYYVDKNSQELVADSIKFFVKKGCLVDGLKLTTKTNVSPGTLLNLKISASSHMFVGLRAMDKSLYLLNNKTDVSKSKIYDILESHDLGCGTGGGRNSAEVFKNAGTTILTNAKLSVKDLLRTAGDCEENKRKKRDTEGCYFGADEECCNKGYSYAEVLLDENDMTEPNVRCYAKARKMAETKTLPVRCILAYLKTCTETLHFFMSGKNTDILSKSLDDENEYSTDIKSLSKNYIYPVLRSDFRESWLFIVENLGTAGEREISPKKYPDSITEWRIEAIGITPHKGICIADPIDVEAYRSFFIQLDIPYSAVRLENFDVKATIFNYEPRKIKAKIYIEGINNVCLNSMPSMGSPSRQITLEPNSAKTVNFPMIPLRQGKYHINVTAIVADKTSSMVDKIRKNLYVVNEGIQEVESIHVCLDPKHRKNDCKNHESVKDEIKEGKQQFTINLTIPMESIFGTEQADVHIYAEVMDNIVTTIIEGVDTLFKEPKGCGEQKMVALAPTVYAMNYLKRTKQMTDVLLETGINWIRKGVSDEIAEYRQENGSYAVFQHEPPSIWLTAFVAKVFCQAKEVVYDAVNQDSDIKTSIDWLVNQVMDNGLFLDNISKVLNQQMLGQTDVTDSTLTAFVLVSLLECDIQTDDYHETIQKSTNYLEGISEETFKSDPYLLAISTYALSLAKSPERYKLKGYLHDIQKDNSDGMYWGDGDNTPACANAVETTAYALLAMISFDDIKNSSSIVRWLTTQRNAAGAFRTTQDTVVGLQALSQYNIATYSSEVDLKIRFLDGIQKGFPREIHVTRDNAIIKQFKKIKVKRGDNKLIFLVSGNGVARMDIDLRYNRKRNATNWELCPFEITDVDVEKQNDSQIDANIGGNWGCDICGRCENDPKIPEDYNDILETFEEKNIEIRSNFGRRKRRSVDLKDKSQKKTCIRFSVRSRKPSVVFGMSNVHFGLETGIEVVEDDLKELIKNNTNIARYEMPSNGKGFIVFYLMKITFNETKFIFRVIDNFEGDKNSRQPASIKVYDYYNPDQQCSNIYGTGPNRAGNVGITCGDATTDRQECKCLRSMCARPITKEIMKLIAARKRIAPLLVKYTCNLEKSNYAVRVTIEKAETITGQHEKVAIGKVISSINTGRFDLERGIEINFSWGMSCNWPLLEEGKNYTIIGMDYNAIKITEDEKIKYQYQLGATALILEEKNKFRRIRNNYYKKMENGCSE
ncbi:venom factor-like [Ruditapes philippinarum]|uniref:venom factor-like n=1 Tax=Ruditapes philippinarum TaxID=129788 RepID=UPI00295BD664|nr:venom factor-like [Ruditapes philippinarum]